MCNGSVQHFYVRSDHISGINYNVLDYEKMSLYSKLLKLKNKLRKNPNEQSRLRRVMSILMRRYDYGIENTEDRMEQYRYGDFRDDIAAVKR